MQKAKHASSHGRLIVFSLDTESAGYRRCAAFDTGLSCCDFERRHPDVEKQYRGHESSESLFNSRGARPSPRIVVESRARYKARILFVVVFPV